MKKIIYLLFLTAFCINTYAQDPVPAEKTYFMNRRSEKGKSAEDDTEYKKNIVSGSSFRKIYERDFTALSGITVQPQDQLILTLNKPEIFIGKTFAIKRKFKDIPAIGVNPYVIGKLNDDGEFIFRKAGEYDPNIGFGGKIYINPFGIFKNGTRYFFDNALPKTQIFKEKRDLAQKELDSKYASQAAVSNKIQTLTNKIISIGNTLYNNEVAKNILENTPTFNDLTNDSTIIVRSIFRMQTISISNDELYMILQKILEKRGYIERKIVDGNKITLKLKDNSQIDLSAEAVIKAFILSEKDIDDLRSKRLKLREELEQINTLELANEKKRKKHYESELYELEKDAPWTTRQFFWLSIDGKQNYQTLNIFRNNALEELQGVGQSFVGISANFTSVMNKAVFNTFLSYEIEKKRKFLDLTPKTFITDSSRISTFNTIETKKAYNLNDLSQKDFDEIQTNKVLNFGMTGLVGDKRKFGITTNIKYTTNTKSTNLKMGLIIPAYKSADGEQANIVLEYQVPDINTKLPANKEQKPSERAFASIKVGIPISMLKPN